MSHYMVAVFTRTDDDAELEELLAPFTENVEEGDPWAVKETDDDGEEYWVNPDAKWDWWVIGGRYSDQLRTKDGFLTDCAKVRDCDFSPDPEAYARAIRFWEINAEGLEPKPGEETPFRYYKPEYYIERYGTKENYATSKSEWGSYAFLTPDGEWVAPGKMGWFACDDATRESIDAYEFAQREYLKKAAEENLWVTIVDCHI